MTNYFVTSGQTSGSITMVPGDQLTVMASGNLGSVFVNGAQAFIDGTLGIAVIANGNYQSGLL